VWQNYSVANPSIPDTEYEKFTFSDERIFEIANQRQNIVWFEFTTSIRPKERREGKKRILETNKTKSLDYLSRAVKSKLVDVQPTFGIAFMKNLTGLSVPVPIVVQVTYDRDTLTDVLTGDLKYPASPAEAEQIQEYLSRVRSFARRNDIPLEEIFDLNLYRRNIEHAIAANLGEKEYKYLFRQTLGHVFEMYMEEVIRRCNGFCAAYSRNNLIESPGKGPDVDYMMVFKEPQDIQKFYGNLQSYSGINLTQTPLASVA